MREGEREREQGGEGVSHAEGEGFQINALHSNDDVLMQNLVPVEEIYLHGIKFHIFTGKCASSVHPLLLKVSP